MSFKNTLQELCQKVGLELPKYKTEMVGGLPHQPVWRSSVSFNGINCSAEEPASTKTDAEQNVAKLCLKYVEEKKEELSPKWEDGNILVLYDMENIGKFPTNIPNNVEVIAFVGMCHPLANSVSTLNVHVEVVKSSVNDAVDHAITFYAGRVCGGEQDWDKIYIVSRDHFAGVTEFLLKSYGYNAEHVPRIGFA